MNTGLRLRRLEHELSLAAFLVNRKIGIYGHRAVGIPVGGDTHAKYSKVDHKDERNRCQQDQNGAQKKSLQSLFQVQG